MQDPLDVNAILGKDLTASEENSFVELLYDTSPW
jgi:hypothetical protein